MPRPEMFNPLRCPTKIGIMSDLRRNTHDCMMFTNKLVLCRHCKSFFEVMYALEIHALEIFALIGDYGWRTE
jgi:hypothetical protein